MEQPSDAVENIVPENVFPNLILKHMKEIEENNDSSILYHVQLHEIYMYQFFKYCKLDTVTEVVINGVKGMIMSPIKTKSFSTKTKVNEKYFFDVLLNSPVPFVFIPYDTSVSSMKNFCNGAYSFRESEKEGILMDLEFACNVGIEFLATEFLERKDVFVIYIGLLYNMK